jgi:hypothetical protein
MIQILFLQYLSAIIFAITDFRESWKRYFCSKLGITSRDLRLSLSFHFFCYYFYSNAGYGRADTSNMVVLNMVVLIVSFVKSILMLIVLWMLLLF